MTNSKIVFSSPLYSTDKNPRALFAIELFKSIQRYLPPDQFLHIVVDDGSTDDAPEVLKLLEKTEPNFIFVPHEHRDGTYAFNLGIDISLDPHSHRAILGDSNVQKIANFDANIVNFTGIDDLIGPACKLVIDTFNVDSTLACCWGNYRAFLADSFSSAPAFAPFNPDLRTLFRDLFEVENFPSHLLYFRKDFLSKIKRARGFPIGVLNPELLSPITYDFMMFTVLYAMENQESFSFLDGHFGYKRYGISGTMTEQNKAAGRYTSERQRVFELNSEKAKVLGIANFTSRPELNRKYFAPLTQQVELNHDEELKSIIEAGHETFTKLTRKP